MFAHRRLEKSLRENYANAHSQRVPLQIYVGEARGPRKRRHSEREEETRDRAERGSAVRGSDQASVALKRTPRLDPNRDAKGNALVRTAPRRKDSRARISRDKSPWRDRRE